MAQSNGSWYRDVLLLFIMLVGASCGIIYEYLLAHYAGRILGMLDMAVYGMIGVMVTSMGVGAFLARFVRNSYVAFVWLELIISSIGGISILLMSAVVSYVFVLPVELQQTFGLDPSIIVDGGSINELRKISKIIPFVIGSTLGLFIGMEIPLIAVIREDIYKNLSNNAGTVYGFDYLGGGIGAAVWVIFSLTKPIIVVAASTAFFNLLLGLIFATCFYSKIKNIATLILIKIVIGIFLVGVLVNGASWVDSMNSMLYKDNVVYSNNTKFQNLVITSRVVGSADKSILDLYINGRLQFSSADEDIYHSMLVVPAMDISARTDHILVIGGGDGLAVREILKYHPDLITLVDLDPGIIKLFTGKDELAPLWLNKRLLSLNKSSLSDGTVLIINRDAFLYIEELVANKERYDVIIVDLPDPNHPDLNKLYSVYFYRQLFEILSGDGALVIQSTSPYHSKDAFISIGVTVNAAGFQVEQYHTNIPSFGEWGWTIATESGLTPLERLKKHADECMNSDIIDRDFVIGAFNFPNFYYIDVAQIESNQLNNPVLYKYHSNGWRNNMGIFINKH
ncbi:MAG: polyamine aminopropyltransferase [Piscirickettsiaceae bacterium]|nr:polyamine aminopropyltransferase [Piscirickettsiaceae bacterium]